MNKVYFDEVYSAQVVDGVVRLKVGLRDVNSDESSITGRDQSDTIICSVGGLVKLQAQIEGLLGALVDRNVIKKRDS